MSWQGFKTRVFIDFQNTLALLVVLPFLAFSVMAALGYTEIELLRVYVPLVSIILGGYFGQEAIREWQRGDPKSEREIEKESGI